jgi:hypothetical protein
MQPHVVIIAGVESPFAYRLIEAFRLIGFSTFYAQADLEQGENRLSRLGEELDSAHAAILIFDHTLRLNGAAAEELLRREIEIVLQHHSRNPLMVVTPVVDTSVTKEIPDELRGFQGVYFSEQFTRSDLRFIVDLALDAWHSAERKGVLPLDQLTAEAHILVPRLDLIISQTRTPEIIAIGVALTATVVGITLSIPSVLARWALPDSWLFIGPIIFIAGGLATAYFLIKERRERRRRKLALFIHSELKELLGKVESLRIDSLRQDRDNVSLQQQG